MQGFYIGILAGIILSLSIVFMWAETSRSKTQIVKERHQAASLQEMTERELRYWQRLSENECHERKIVQEQLSDLNILYMQLQGELERTQDRLANAEQRVISTTQELKIVQQQLARADGLLVTYM